MVEPLVLIEFDGPASKNTRLQSCEATPSCMLHQSSSHILALAARPEHRRRIGYGLHPPWEQDRLRVRSIISSHVPARVRELYMHVLCLMRP